MAAQRRLPVSPRPGNAPGASPWGRAAGRLPRAPRYNRTRARSSVMTPRGRRARPWRAAPRCAPAHRPLRRSRGGPGRWTTRAPRAATLRAPDRRTPSARWRPGATRGGPSPRSTGRAAASAGPHHDRRTRGVREIGHITPDRVAASSRLVVRHHDGSAERVRAIISVLRRRVRRADCGSARTCPRGDRSVECRRRGAAHPVA